MRRYRRASADRAWLMSLPATLLLLLAFVGPLAILILYSLGILGDGASAGLGLYGQVLGDGYFLKVVGQTLLLGIVVTLITLILGYPIATSIAHSTGRKRTLLLVLVVAPLLTNIVVRTLSWLIILADNGPVNAFLKAFFGDAGFSFLGSFAGIAIALVQVFLPFMVLPMLSSIERIPPSAREAALTHGAHPLVAFFRISVPLTAPGIVAGATLTFLLSIGALVTPMIVGQGRVQVLSTLILQQISLTKWGVAAALAMVLFVAAMAIVMAAQVASAAVSGTRTRRRRTGIFRRGYVELRALISHTMHRLPDFVRFTKGSGIVFRSLVLCFLGLPLLFVIKSAVDSSQILHAGFESFTLKWFGEAFDDQLYVNAFLLSLRLALTTVVICLAIALPAGFALVRGNFPGRSVLLAFFLSPLTVPHMVLAVGFVLYFQIVGADPSFTRLSVVHLIIVLPYVIRVIVSALQSLDPRMEEAARTLGASGLTTFRRISTPLLKPAVFSASLFGFLVSFDEVTITLLVAGTRSQTLPLRMFDQLTQYWTPQISAISTVLIGVTVVSIFLIERVVGLSSFKVGAPS